MKNKLDAKKPDAGECGQEGWFKKLASVGIHKALMTLCLAGATVQGAFGQHLQMAQDGAFMPTNTFAYLITHRNYQEVSVARGSATNVTILFTKSYSNDVVLPPICVSNGIVVVSVDGVVRKYGFDGKEIFSYKALKDQEMSKLAGRWDLGTIYLSGLTYDGPLGSRKQRYRVVWVSVGGGAAVGKGSAKIEDPVRVFRVEDEVVICGETNVVRVAPPKGVLVSDE